MPSSNSSSSKPPAPSPRGLQYTFGTAARALLYGALHKAPEEKPLPSREKAAKL